MALSSRTQPASVADLLAARAAESPDAVAICAPEQQPLSYAALADRARAMRADLARAGIGPGRPVALVVRNGPAAATAFLGIAGATACAPLNPAYREEELSFLLRDLGVAAVVVERGLPTPVREVAARLGAAVLELEPLPGAAGTVVLEPASAGSGRVPPREGVEGVAMLLHTSGTTSRPKLVPIRETSLVASAFTVAGSLGLDPDDRCLNVMPLFHVHGLVACVLAPLAAGSSVSCAPGFDAASVLRWAEEERATWLSAVPTMHQALLARGGAGPGFRPRLLRSSSAALPATVAESLERRFGCPVLEAYGMTEAAHQIASNPPPPGERRAGSVGLPTGVEVSILGPAGAPLPPGETGEIAVRGPTVFAGYLGDADATASAFVGGWFRTGDEGLLDADGYLHLRGRLKEIINRGGEKISPREVDEALLRHPAVADAVAFAEPHAGLGEDVAAAVVLRPGARVSAGELQRFVAGALADFKVPRRIVLVDELPKGPTGKVSRLGLAERLGDAEALGGSGPSRGGGDGLVRDLCALFALVLDAPAVEPDDDFFALGGDSLAAARLVAELEERGHGARRLRPAVLLWAPTPSMLAAVLAGEDGERGLFVRLAGEGERPPLFFLHPHDGSAVYYTRLARSLPGDRPFLAAVAEPGSASVRPVEELGRAYAAEMQAVQPEGPYLLGGLCMGGAIALEAARALRDAGETVALLALVNPLGAEFVGPARRWLRRARYLYRERDLLAGMARFVRDRARGLRPASRRRRTRPERRFADAMQATGRRYVAEPYGGPMVLLTTKDYGTPPGAWNRVAAGPLVEERIDADIVAAFGGSALDRLASALERALEAADPADGRPLSERAPGARSAGAEVGDDDRGGPDAEGALRRPDPRAPDPDLPEAGLEEDRPVGRARQPHADGLGGGDPGGAPQDRLSDR